LVPYLNFHRPCYFPKIKVDKKGKEKKTYPYDMMMTPFEKFKSLENAEGYLKPGVKMEDLEKEAMLMTDYESAIQTKKAQKNCFKRFSKSKG